MVSILIAILAASPAPHAHPTSVGVTSFNLEQACIAKPTIDRALQIAVEELIKECPVWTKEKVDKVLSRTYLFWRSSAWLQESDSCKDIPIYLQTKLGKDQNGNDRVSCNVIGLQSGSQLRVALSGDWGDTLTHELAHLFQWQLDGLSDVHHTGFAKDSCISKAIKSASNRMNDEFAAPKYKCVPNRRR